MTTSESKTNGAKRDGASVEQAVPTGFAEAIDPADLRDLVAECVLDKIEESRRLGLFLDRVIDRVNEWQRDVAMDTQTVPAPSIPRSVMLGLGDDAAAAPSAPNNRRPLFYKFEDDPFSSIKTRALVSCLDNCSREGGIFELDFARNTFRLVVMCDGRGIARYGDGYLVASRDRGIFLLDEGLDIKNNWKLPGLDLHGIACGPDGLVYIVETRHNRIGIFTIEPFKRVDEIVVSPDEDDRNHINDLSFHDDKLMLSMFSTKEYWRKNMEAGVFDGAIAEFDFRKKELLGYVARGLQMPHTLMYIGDELCYCESFALTAKRSGRAIAKYSGYTRGLAYDGRFFYVGQSRFRHRRRHSELTLSSDGGLHLLDPKEGLARFVQLPASDFYAIEILS